MHFTDAQYHLLQAEKALERAADSAKDPSAFQVAQREAAQARRARKRLKKYDHERKRP